MTPEDLLYNKLTAYFPAAQVAPAGTVVYHETGDPIDPFVLYRRSSTNMDRDLQGMLHATIAEFEVSIESKFFTEVAVTMPDNWTDSGWYFTLEDQQSDYENYRTVFNYVAAKAF